MTKKQIIPMNNAYYWAPARNATDVTTAVDDWLARNTFVFYRDNGFTMTKVGAMYRDDILYEFTRSNVDMPEGPAVLLRVVMTGGDKTPRTLNSLLAPQGFIPYKPTSMLAKRIYA